MRESFLHPAEREFHSLTYVVGHSRGGTTWLGELVGCHSAVRYIFEPFASQAHPCTGIDMQTVFNGGRFILRGKIGAPVLDAPVRKFLRDTESDPTGGLLGALARTHLRELARRAFPGQRPYHLVVKQPRIENVEWAVDALPADFVVAIDRHPFGVVNSVRRWQMLKWVRLDWAMLEQDPELSKELRPMIAAARIPEERLLVLSWLRSRHLRSFVASRPKAVLVEYEILCRHPLEETLRVWRHMGLAADGVGRERLEGLLEKRCEEGDVRTRFLNTHRDPATRLCAWRHELPDRLRRRLEAFVRRHALPIPLPGDGLPELSTAERIVAKRNDILAVGDDCRRLVRSITGQDRIRAA